MPPDYESCRLDTGELLKLLTGLIAAASVISILFYNSLIPAISAIVLLIPVRRAAEKQKAQKKKDQVVSAFRDVCFCIASSFATGRHMPESLREAEEEMKRIYPGDHPIVQELAWMNHRIADQRETDITVLKDLAFRTGSEDIGDFVTAYHSCRETGGDLPRVMEQCSERIAEKITIESDIRAMAVQKKYEGRIISFMPAVIILFLRIVSPDYVAILYAGWFGKGLMTLALLATAFACILIERITAIDV